MKRILRTAAASMLFLTVCSVVGYLAYFLNIKSFWVMFAIATAVLVVGIALSFVKRTWVRTVAFFINAVSTGFFLQSWYINRGFDNPLWLMLAVSALAEVYLLVFVLPLLVPAINRHYGVYLGVFFAISVGGYISLLVLTKTTWVSTLGYYGILQLSFILGSSFRTNDWDDEVQALLVSSFGVVVCAVIILLIVATSSCDADCGGCDCSTGDFSSPVSGNKQRPKAPAEILSQSESKL